MPDLITSVLPSLSGAGKANSPNSENNLAADDPNSFQTFLSGQMAAKDKPTMSTPATKPADATEKTAAEKNEEKDSSIAEQSQSVNPTVPAEIAVTPLPIGLVIPASVTPLANNSQSGNNILPKKDSEGKGLNEINSAAPTTLLTDNASANSGSQSIDLQEQKLAGQQQFKIPEVNIKGNVEPRLETKSTQENYQTEQNDLINSLPNASLTNINSTNHSEKLVESKLSLQSRVGSAAWTGELANKVTYMVGEKMQSAELRLNPENLGPISVRIEIQKDQQTTISFQAINPETRNVLENAMSQLRNMLNESGISVSGFSVGAEAFTGASQQGNGDRRQTGSNSSTNESAANGVTSTTRTVGPNGMVDTFA